jgi:hypothetical protein
MNTPLRIANIGRPEGDPSGRLFHLGSTDSGLAGVTD